MLLTTQYLEEADRLADRIAVVDHGRVIADGTAAELKAQLGSTIIHVEVADPNVADAAKTVLAEIGPTDLSDDGRSIEVKVTDSGRSLLAVVRRLDAAGIEPVAVTVREPSLDDVFLTLTGRPYRRRRRPGGGQLMAAITAPAMTPTVEQRSPLGWAVSDAITIAWRNLKAMSRTPEVIMFSTIQPIIFVLTFRYVFGTSITLPGNLPYV